MALTDERYNQTAALLPPEPSRAEYWLDKGFSDLGATIREAIVLNRVTRGELITELYNGALYTRSCGASASSRFLLRALRER